jgi:2'-deoxynucleoside 5'-phosphate N-hydrolase
VAFPELEGKATDEEIYNGDVERFNQSDIMVAEVTSPSHGVGMELGWATLRKEYPVLCLTLASPQYKTSALIKGCPQFILREYTQASEATDAIKKFFEQSQ